MVLTDTQSVRRQVIERFHLSPDRVAAAPLAASTLFRPVDPQDRPPYFLFTGTLEPRKNVPILIEAWRTVRRRHAVELILAGRRRRDCPEILPEAGLHVLGEVPDSALPALYSGAVALVYPSAYEGFGLPILEAFQCGAGVIASRDPALLEVSGGAALHVDVSELATAMWRVLEDDGLRRELKARALERARAFSWDRTARMTREVYVHAQDRFYV
jgi:glycosyltransferase involved in cell wall biosynthesis